MIKVESFKSELKRESSQSKLLLPNKKSNDSGGLTLPLHAADSFFFEKEDMQLK